MIPSGIDYDDNENVFERLERFLQLSDDNIYDYFDPKKKQLTRNCNYQIV